MPAIDLGATKAGPGTHALVVGVSHYPFLSGPQTSEFGAQLGLDDLTSATRSASEVVAWLLSEYRNPGAPLASLRVALSPAEGETLADGVAARLPEHYAATRDTVEKDLIAFRTACQDPQNVGFVYVAGHGIQLTKRGAIVLLEDFADPGRAELYGAIDMVGCHASLYGTGYADNQFWFVDACRQLPAVARKFEDLEAGVLTLKAPPGEVDCSPLFLASASRDLAFAEVGGLTLFSRVLLSALRGAAAVGPEAALGVGWHVSAARLGEVLKADVAAAAKAKSEDQSVQPVGWPGRAVIQRFDDPPAVRVVLTLEPSLAAEHTTVSMLFDADEDQKAVDGTMEWPLERTVPAGLYQIRVETSEPYRPVDPRRLVSVNPLEYVDVIEVVQ
jgi:Caspase domain